MGEIEKLRNDINLLRQEKTMFQNNLKSLQTDIDKAEQEINNLT
jgi:peptidoglycan hydrolase CwlO-like protein